MSELASAIHATKTGTEDCTTAMQDALQHRFGFPITLTELAYEPPTDTVRVRVHPRSDEVAVEHRLSRGDNDLELNRIRGTIEFEFD